jgi:hypothetical protein
MAEVKCLACRKMNFAGDRFCAACGSSLDLKLCASCEAINNPVADSCHSCGKPLATAEAPATPVLEVSEAPFYAPQRFQRERVYDSHPSLVARLNRAAKVTTLVVLPLAAIGLWGWQFYGQKLLQTVSPWVKTPAAPVLTKVAPVPAAVVGPLPAVVVPEVPKAKPVAAETKRPPKSTQARTATVAAPAVAQKPAVAETAPEPAREVAARPSPVPATVRKGVTHTRAASAAATAAPTQAPTTPTQAPVTPEASASAAPADSGAHVTHTKAAPSGATGTTESSKAAGTAQAVGPAAPSVSSAPVADAPAAPAPPLTGGSASCPQAAAVLGLCSPNTQKGGS